MNETFILFAKPWWVNLLLILPFAGYYLWRGRLTIPARVLALTAILATAFGFVEAATVVYLRGAAGLLGTPIGAADVYQQALILGQLPKNLLSIEIAREAATMIMLITIALVATNTKYNRWAIYFWTFAIWDICYYLGLFFTIGWPPSLTTTDVLFLIPVPWYAQVWFAILTSGLFITAVIAGRKKMTQ